ncbi:hypothetical protein CNEO4_100127 [Clostridium neonatale]|nr:hypothetical protein CNEO_640074 [Clostridium neonatale]CAI3554970.1 hypothetical protein CNEO4_100127 [Clostridium neonatale]
MIYSVFRVIYSINKKERKYSNYENTHTYRNTKYGARKNFSRANRGI